ncbi:MAG: hypothetical protein AAGF25_09405, partial [Pseudomonadota bacterium]
SYQLKVDQLFNEKRHGNSNAIDSLERLLSQEFDGILDYLPANRAEALILVEFLLVELSETKTGSTVPDQINDKILEVVAAGQETYSIQING